jgi:parvulin-like peptidyl-prolyl isomerase
MVYISALMLILINGCGGSDKLTDAELERIALAEKVELVESAGGFVLMVGGEPISSTELIEQPTILGGDYVAPLEYFKPAAQTERLAQFKERARDPFTEVLLGRIANILMYQYSKRQAGQNVESALDKAAEAELRKFVLDYGGDQAKADEELAKRGLDRNKYKEEQKKSILIQWYVTSKLPTNRPVTYRELVDRYNKMKDKYFYTPGIIQFRLIDIRPNQLEVTGSNQNANQLAKKLADELLERINSGEDFGELAKEYSHGHMSAFGGLWKPVGPQSLVAPYDVLAAEAKKIEPGQVAGPITTPGHVCIMKLETKQTAAYEPFENVQGKVEDAIRLERRNDVVAKINEKLIQQAEFSETEEFIDFCLEEIYRISNQ